jgi:hypothetical protein
MNKQQSACGLKELGKVQLAQKLRNRPFCRDIHTRRGAVFSHASHFDWNLVAVVTLDNAKPIPKTG